MDVQKFFESVAELCEVDVSTLTPETRLAEDLHVSSFLTFNLCVMMEDFGGKAVSFADLNGCKTLGEVIALSNG